MIYLGAGGGGSGGGLNKLIYDFTNVDSINVNYSGGKIPPILQIYDDQGNIITPENIHYDYANTIKIDFGETLNSVKVVVV